MPECKIKCLERISWERGRYDKQSRCCHGFFYAFIRGEEFPRYFSSSVDFHALLDMLVQDGIDCTQFKRVHYIAEREMHGGE